MESALDTGVGKQKHRGRMLVYVLGKEGGDYSSFGFANGCE